MPNQHVTNSLPEKHRHEDPHASFNSIITFDQTASAVLESAATPPSSVPPPPPQRTPPETPPPPPPYQMCWKDYENQINSGYGSYRPRSPPSTPPPPPPKDLAPASSYSPNLVEQRAGKYSPNLVERSASKVDIQNNDDYLCEKSIRLPRERRVARWSSVERSPHCDPTGCKYPDGALTKIAREQLSFWVKSGGLHGLVSEVLQRRSEMDTALLW